jgi:D-methionine transport system ATP-binding protein
MIDLIHVEKQYLYQGQLITALSDINLRIKSGEIFGIIGPSGAGKSTLVRCINMLERPSQGQIIIDQQDIRTLSESQLRQTRRKIGMIFQHFNLLSSRTVFDNVALALELAHVKKAKIKTIVDNLLDLTGLSNKKNRYPKQLSGGEKQRVAIARALANNPSLLLCDEATSALDPETTEAILKLLKDINQKLGITILLITHEMQVVKTICDRLAVIEQGKIIEQADVLEFFSKPQTNIAKKFVRADLADHLPSMIKNRFSKEIAPNTNPLLFISFLGEAAQEPLISQVVKKFDIHLNILQANIEYIANQMVGVMLVEAEGNPQNLSEVLDYFASKGIPAEILGYLKK